MSPLLRDDDDLLILSSDTKMVESANASTVMFKTKPAKPTNVTAMLKAPPVKQLKKKHLPKGCQMENKWAREFIPTAICYIGDLDERVWDVVYKGKILHTVVANGPVVALWLSEWRNTISNVALVVLVNFMTSQDDIYTDWCLVT
ncbi:uncharacterized protein EDB93DRAFT_1246977 [Suillus bovinus]|uniref:uncharacterized protein n=1 Tax=Suillus bovinus TaxID=48563 RepID=UPI001B885568|nr:uncharacterized protein EDB93DRAFT_1246977 [Suillus bovinus]KAG2156786.1 hypothetical protein EDB93DRAFT_1246977 [Suillus bovinus]